MPVTVDSRATEPIAFTLLENGAGVTGASLRYDVTRVVAGALQWLNRTTATFVASVPADGDRYRTLAQVDAVNQPGDYAVALGGVDLPAITNATIPLPDAPLVYVVTFYQVTPTARILDADEIRAGVEDTIRRRITNREEQDALGVGRSYRDDGVTVEATYTVRTKTNTIPTIGDNDPAKRGGEVPS